MVFRPFDRVRPASRHKSRLRRSRQIGFEPLESRLVLSNVTMWRNDPSGTGQDLLESSLTPSTVTSSSFGKQFTTAVDGIVYAQPLVVSGVNITTGPAAGVHDVVFVATEHDSLYAIDADNTDTHGNGVVLWKDSFINPAAGVTTVPTAVVNSTDITPEIGITGTPVIDSSTNTLYVVAKTQEVVGGVTHYVQRLHAIDLGSGQEKFGGPAVIADTTLNSDGSYTYNSGPSVYGSGGNAIVDSKSGKQIVPFNALRQLERSALFLDNGSVFIAFASHGDNGPYNGWLLGYNETTLQPSAVINLTPNATEGGVWQAAGAPTVDAQGNIFLETGNGTFDSTLNAAGFPINGDYGNSFVKLSFDPNSSSTNQNINGWGMKVTDYFTPSDQSSLDAVDLDLGSGGPLLLPDSVGSAAHLHLLVGGGKEGTLYLIDRDNMGKYDPNGDHVVQELPKAVNGVFGVPGYYNGTIYYVGGYGDVAKTFSISNGVLSTSPTSQSSDSFSFPGSSPSISANGSTGGLIWDVDRGTNQLRAYSAASYAIELYNSSLAPNGRDQVGQVVKFSVPTIANGRVYLGTTTSLQVYGLFTAPTTLPASPTNLSATTASGGQVNLNWSDNSTNESGFAVDESTDGVNFTQVATTAPNAQTYDLGGLNPSTTYWFRVRAINVIGSSNPSNTASATTTTQSGLIDFSGGFAGADGVLARNGSAIIAGNALRLTDGGSNEAASAFTKSKVNVAQFSTQFSFLLTNATADGFTFTIQGVSPSALGPVGGSLGYGSTGPGGILSSVAVKFDLYNNGGEGSDSTGLYINGQQPGLTNSIDLSGTGVDLHSGDVMKAALTYDGTTLSVTITDTVTGKSASQSYTVNIPGLVGGNSAYVGFTAGTGGLSATQDILGWTYNPSASVPAAPTALSVSAASGTQANLSWTDNANNATAYVVERQDSPSGPFVALATLAPNATNYSDSTLTSGNTYSYAVYAVNGTANSALSNTVSVTMPTLPATPSGASVTLLAANQVNLSWNDNATNETGYRIFRKDGTGGTFNLVATLPANSTSYNDVNVAPNTAYDYHIQAYNVAGYSDFAGLSTTTPPAQNQSGPAISFPTGFSSAQGLAFNGSAALYGSSLRLTNGGSFEAASVFDVAPVNVAQFSTQFNFLLSSANADGFTFTIQNAGPQALGPVGGSLGYGASTTAPGIGKSLAVKFDIFDNAGEGYDSTGLYTNGAFPGPAGSIDLTNSAIHLHNGHVFNASLTYNGSVLKVTITDTGTGQSANQSYFVNIPALVGGNTAYVGFTAGTGGMSAVQDILNWTYTPTSTTVNVPSAPTGLQASADVGLVFLSWSPVQGAATYNVYRGTTSGGEAGTPIVTGLTSPSFLDTGLTNGITYDYQVAAVNSGGVSSRSAEASATPQAPIQNGLILNDAGGFGAAQGLALNGSAKLNGSSLRLTDGGSNEAGSAFATTPVNITQFSTQFNFLLTNANADGFTFTIQGNGPSALGATGGSLGYGTSSTGAGIGKSVAVKFDLFDNAGEHYDSTGLYTNGTNPTLVNSIDLSNTAINLHSGHIFNAALVYDGSSLKVTITDTVTAATFTQSYAVNIPAQVGGNTAYVGFTGGTGGLSAVQDILNWTYSAKPAAPINASATGSDSQTSLVWNPVVGPSTYNVYRSSTSGGEGATPIVAGLPLPFFTDFGLVNGTTYYYQVSAVNSIGEGLRSAEFSATPRGTTSTPPVINDSGGFASPQGLAFSGSAKLNGPSLRLTDGGSNEASSAFTATPVSVAQFSTQFNFLLTNPNADGFTFTIQGNGPLVVGATGGSLGYGGSGNVAGIPNSVAVKFDLFDNTNEGYDSTGLYTNGANPMAVNSIDLSNTGIDLHSGHIFNAKLTYDGSTLKVTITDTTNGQAASQSYGVNIPSLVGGNQAYVGFTAGTGGLSAVQDILNWTYNAVPWAPATPSFSASDARLSLNWPATPGAVTYNVYRGTTSGGEVLLSTGLTSPNFTDSGVNNGIVYYYQVTAVNSFGESARSAQVSAAPIPSISFATGFSGPLGLALNGSAKLNGSSLRLSDGGSNEAGSVFSATPVNIAQFSTQFNFLLTNPNADGFTFTIQGNGPLVVGATGGSLGYGGSGNVAGIPNSVAVKFDLFDNTNEGYDSTGLYTNGANPMAVNSIDLSKTGIDLHSGHVFNAKLTYDGSNLKVTITDTTTGQSASQTYAVNIPAIVGGSTGYVGFTAGTGGLSATQDILGWTFGRQ